MPKWLEFRRVLFRSRPSPQSAWLPCGRARGTGRWRGAVARCKLAPRPVRDLLDSLRQALADRYAVERELGRGGMATVFLAQDLKHQRSVAIKVLHSELTATLRPERFVREIEIAA